MMIKIVKVILIIFISINILSTEAKKQWVNVKEPISRYENFTLLDCDSNTCYAVTDVDLSFRLYKSIDFGKSWNEMIFNYRLNGEFYNQGNCFLIDSSNLFININDRVCVAVTKDGGKNFRFEFFEEPEDEWHYFYGLTSYKKIYAAGITRKYIIHTDNFWETYEKIPIPDSIDVAIDPLFFIDSNRIAFSRYDGYDAEFIEFNKQTKQFLPWSKGTKAGEYNKLLNKIDFVNDSLGFGCGLQFFDGSAASNALIWKTTNKGKNWEVILDTKLDPPFGLFDISFKDEMHGIASGTGVILETIDGGESWFLQDVENVRYKLFSPLLTWAGDYPLFADGGDGIYRYETISNVEELSSDEKFRVYQSGRNLEIAINDPTHKQYSFELYSQTGQRLLTRSVGSAFGFIFQPVELIELRNGAYFYTISSSAGVEFSGKLVVAE